MTETDTIASKDALLADLRHGDPEGIIVTPENVFAAVVQADEAVMFRDGWGYLRIRAVPPSKYPRSAIDQSEALAQANVLGARRLSHVGRPDPGRRQAAPVIASAPPRAGAAPLGTMIGTPACPVMDRIYLAVIASALLLLLGAAGLFVLMNGDLDVMHHARTVGVAGTK